MIYDNEMEIANQKWMKDNIGLGIYSSHPYSLWDGQEYPKIELFNIYRREECSCDFTSLLRNERYFYIAAYQDLDFR